MVPVLRPHFQGQHLRLPRGRDREPIRVHRLDALPPETIVQAELGYGKIFLTTIRTLEDPGATVSGKAGRVDIGSTRLGMVSHSQGALAVSGRDLRSVKQSRTEALARRQKKRCRTQPGSRRRRLSQKVNRGSRHALHPAANQVIEFCVTRELTVLYADDLGTLNHQTRHRRSRPIHQNLGRLKQYLASKLHPTRDNL